MGPPDLEAGPLDPPAELARRMARPQRHRLLHGYPMLPLMRRAVPEGSSPWQVERELDGALRSGREQVEPPWIDPDGSRPLIIGVLPHAQCHPRVEGCGFCTFPHDAYERRTLRRVASRVAAQIESFCRTSAKTCERAVAAVYFGGATANLAPPGSLARIGRALSAHFDLSRAELTLEGVPALFASVLRGSLGWLLEMPVGRRLSMGIQTFDAAQLAHMGRRAFGDRATVERVVARAHRLDMTVSGDFLINLPGEPLEQMLTDIDIAASIGLDQTCFYHLVLAPDLGVPWARDPSVLRALPGVEQAFENWATAREALLARGYAQTTLTNFEREGVRGTDRAFRYEECSFRPELHDALGFGPLSISTFIDPARRRAVKLVRGKTFREEAAAWGDSDLYFPYDEDDLRLLFVTRGLALLSLDRAVHERWFGSDVVRCFEPCWDAGREAGLVEIAADRVTLTPRGMFFADSLVGLLAAEQVEKHRPRAAGTRTRDVIGSRTSFVDFMG